MRKRAALVISLASVLVGLLAPAAVAHQVQGAHWGIQDTLCAVDPCVQAGNQVGMWQTILWDGGYLVKCGSSGVDGHFGSVTKQATKDWQAAHGITADGIVGDQTWSTARDSVVWDYSVEDLRFYHYNGRTHDSKFAWANSFQTPNNWIFQPAADVGVGSYYFDTGHPGIDFDRC
jgi:Putative peptidoglycan binding domain